MRLQTLLLVCLAAVAVAKTTNDPCDFSLMRDRSNAYKPKPVTVMPAESYAVGLRRHVKRWSDRFPLLKNLIDSKVEETQSQVIKSITGRGFLHYSQQAALQAIESVDSDMYDAFVQYMLSSLEIPSNMADTINAELFEIIKWADNSDWVQYTTTFSDSKMNAKYICVLGHRNIERNTYDFVVADFKNTFELAPDILVVRTSKSSMWGLFGSSSTKVVYLPPSLKKEDVELVSSFFDMAAFTRFAKMLDVEVQGTSKVDPITIIAGVSAGLDLWGKITNLFKTTKTSTLVKEIMGEGFDFYVQRSVVNVIQGIPEQNMIYNLVPLIPRMFRLGAEVAEDVQMAICIGRYVDEYAFNKNDFLFNSNGDELGNVRFADVIVQRPSFMEDKFNLILANVAQEFRLAPSIHVIEHSKSVLGGIYESTKIEYRRIPRQLTQKDMEVLMAFFHVTTFKRIAMHLNVQIKYPDPPTTTP